MFRKHTYGSCYLERINRERHHHLLLKLDLLGIAIMFGGSYMPAVLMGFPCAPFARAIYLTVALATLISGILVGLRLIPRRYGTPSFVFLGVIGPIPAAH